MYDEPLISRINRLMQELEESIDKIQSISSELANIVSDERNSYDDGK
jgi:hypothetical protein